MRICNPQNIANAAVENKGYNPATLSAALIAEAKPRMYALLKYFRGFENEYGLLESLESWVFVEWSRYRHALGA